MEYISYYIDEHLLDIADNRIDTVEFFRRYTAGFLISRRESAMSLCGSDYVRGVDNQTADTTDLICAMFRTTPLVRTERFFSNSVYRFNSTVNDASCTGGSGIPFYSTVVECTIENLTREYLGRARYPECNNISLEISRNLENVVNPLRFVIEDSTTDLSIYNGTIFRVDGVIRETALSYSAPAGFNSTFGRRHAEFSNSDITGATIYYNNQVIILTNSHPSSIFSGQRQP